MLDNLNDIFDKELRSEPTFESAVKYSLEFLSRNEDLYNDKCVEELYRRLFEVEASHVASYINIYSCVLTYLLQTGYGESIEEILARCGDSVPKYFCEYRKDIKKVVLPNNIKKIKSCAFYNCKSLESIDFSNSIEEVESHSFSGCNNLAQVLNTDALTDINDYAFKECTALSQIDLHANVKNVGERAFYKCDTLESIYLNKCINLGEEAFAQCGSLITVFINSSLENIGYNPFEDCLIETAVVPVKSCATVYNGDLKSLSILGEGEIPDYAFTDCKNLTKVTLGRNITGIGKYVFKGCSAIETFEYLGSKDSWNAIKKGDRWREDSGITKVTLDAGGYIELGEGD